jgi:hypothetical protein
MINIDLFCIDEHEQPVTFSLFPTSIMGYETCAWSITGKHVIIRLLFDTYNEWIINMTDRTAVHVISNLATGIERRSYKFEKLIVK